MLGNRNEIETDSNTLESPKKRIYVETLRYLRENDSDQFEELKQQLQGTDLWNQFQKEYG